MPVNYCPKGEFSVPEDKIGQVLLKGMANSRHFFGFDCEYGTAKFGCVHRYDQKIIEVTFSPSIGLKE